jgi:signal transduction histidine kinase
VKAAPRRFQLTALLRASLIFTALALYLAGCLIIYAFQVRQTRIDLHYLLYSEAESLASYLASTGKLDFPELVSIDENVPTPVWMRVVERGRVIAATPHFPDIPLAAPAELAPLLGEAAKKGPEHDEEEEEEPSLLTARSRDGGAYPLVRHAVWNRDDTYVEVVTHRGAAGRRLRTLLATLALTGLILLPLAAVVAELVSRPLLRPIEELIAAIHRIEAKNLGSRLESAGRVAEIADLTEEFNGLLDRVEAEVKRMRRFTANASHELRTPIASLRAGIDVCLRRPREAEEYREHLAESLHEIDRVQRVVEGLLALAREPEGARYPSVREPVDLAAVVERTCRVLQPLADEKQIELQVTSAGSPVATGDPAQIELMLINLVDNAIRHSARGKEVRIEASRKDGHARLLVVDQGPGIPKQERAAVFDRYFQGGAEERSPRIGGIGLDLVRWVVEVHGGEVRVVDDDEPGAKFEILLPAESD